MKPVEVVNLASILLICPRLICRRILQPNLTIRPGDDWQIWVVSTTVKGRATSITLGTNG